MTHKFANVPKGALGLFQAGDGHTDTPAAVVDANGDPVEMEEAAGGH